MKTKIFFSALAVLFSVNISMANQSGATLTFWNALGEKLIQPIMIEESTETLPVEIQCAFQIMKRSDVYRVFDLSELTRPEQEEELPYYIRNDYHSAR